jgi:hypothetical protein
MNTNHSQLQQKDIENLQEKVQDINKIVNDGFSEMRSEFKVLRDNYVTTKQLTELLVFRDEKIDSLQDNQKWLVRTVLGFIIVGILTVIVTFKS